MYVGPVEELKNIFSKEEKLQVRKDNLVMLENIAKLCDDIHEDCFKAGNGTRLINNRVSLTKDVLSECMCDLYMDSLVIDDPDRYRESLTKNMRNECMEIMKEATSIADLEKMFEHSSQYIKDALILAETICDSKDPEELKASDVVALTPQDIHLIEEFEDIEGKKEYANEIQDRVVRVFDKERENAEARREKIDNMVSTLADKADTSEKLAESIESGITYFSNEPKTLFNAIFVNKSKMLINEDAEAVDLANNEEMVLAETICTYTLLECINALGFKTYTDDEKLDMRYRFFTGR